MKQLWSPWRMEYILSKERGNCVFCDAFSVDLSRDRERLVLHRGEHCGVMMNLFPYNNGHIMVIPFTHVATFTDLSPDALLEVMSLVNKSVRVLGQSMNAEGFNIGANLGKVAGAGIADHVHMHVVPRWAGDTNFLSTVSQMRCIPESLHDSYDKLKIAWDRDPSSPQ
jgi:ATP adenylyltransferase